MNAEYLLIGFGIVHIRFSCFAPNFECKKAGYVPGPLDDAFVTCLLFCCLIVCFFCFCTCHSVNHSAIDLGLMIVAIK